jgi:subtilase family serine protease
MSKKFRAMLSLILVISFVASSASIAVSYNPHDSGDRISASPIHQLDVSLAPVPFSGNILNNGSAKSFNMEVSVSLSPANESQLSSFLSNLSNPSSIQYHHYISASTFDRLYAPSESYYQGLVNYFKSYGVTNFTKFPNRLILSMSGSSKDFSAAFNTGIMSLNGTSSFGPDRNPEIPEWAAENITGVTGLTSASVAVDAPLTLNMLGSSSYGVTGSSFPSPILSKTGVEYSYGSDYQVAYNETGLFTSSYDSNVSIATILWTGSYNTSSGTHYVGPYDPSDLQKYFNNSTSFPSFEPKPVITPIPVDGAPSPSSSASKDTSGAVTENTLDLEIAGSLAPGAHVYNVYSKTSSLAEIADALNTVISNTSSSGLGNVSVVSMSFGTSDYVNSTWNGILQEAQARGITVLASSGDSGDNANSPKFVSSSNPYPGTFVQFPSSLAYNDYGITAVGGTTLIINQNNEQIENQTVWYETPSYTGGNPIGTSSGISDYYTEPVWQNDSIANNLIQGAGRGVPDIADVGNNTLVYLTNSTGKSGLFILAGTSVSSPVAAGIVATINEYLQNHGKKDLGFLDPTIYKIGNDEYTNSSNRSLLNNPNPFYNIIYGSNALYSAGHGYSLVAGMGSINAYAFAQDSVFKTYHLYFNETGLPSGQEWNVTVGGVTRSSIGSSIEFNLTNGNQSYFIGYSGNYSPDPQYGYRLIKNKNVTINVVFVAGFRVQFTSSGLPHVNPLTGGIDSFTVYLNNSVLKFETTFTDTDSGGVAYAVIPDGVYNYRAIAADGNYVAKRSSLTVSGSPVQREVNFTLGTFSIKFVESGLPSGQEWSVSNRTTTLYSNNTTIDFISLGGEYSFQLNYSKNYVPSFLLLNMNTAGVNKTFNVKFTYGYSVNITESGLPDGTNWSIAQGEYLYSTNQSSLLLEFPNGTYNFSVYKVLGYSPTYTGTFVVNGSNVSIHVYFTREQVLSGKLELAYVLAALALIAIIAVVFISRK